MEVERVDVELDVGDVVGVPYVEVALVVKLVVGVLIAHPWKVLSRYALTASLRSAAAASQSALFRASGLPCTKPPARHVSVPVFDPRFRREIITVLILLTRSKQMSSSWLGSIKSGTTAP